MEGDKGSPCLIPWDGLRGREGEPLIKVEKKAKGTRFLT